jgi:hypothetical protein
VSTVRELVKSAWNVSVMWKVNTRGPRSMDDTDIYGEDFYLEVKRDEAEERELIREQADDRYWRER